MIVCCCVQATECETIVRKASVFPCQNYIFEYINRERMGTVFLPNSESIEVTPVETVLRCFQEDLIRFGNHSDLPTVGNTNNYYYAVQTPGA